MMKVVGGSVWKEEKRSIVRKRVMIREKKGSNESADCHTRLSIHVCRLSDSTVKMLGVALSLEHFNCYWLV